MRWWATILLLLAAAIGVALAIPVGLGRGPGASAGGPRPFIDDPSLALERIDEIVVERRGAATLRFVRAGDGWIEREPSGLAVDPFALRAVVDAVRRLETTRTVSGDDDPAGNGATLRRRLDLDPPAATLTLRGGGRSHEIRLGRVGVAGRAFAQDGGRQEEIAVVGQELHALLLQGDPGLWRVRSLFPEAGAETTRIEHQTANSTLRVTRVGSRWRMEMPVATRVDPAAMSAYLAALARAECAGFLGESVDPRSGAERRGDAGLDPAAAELRVTDGTDAATTTRTLRVGRAVTVGGGDRFGELDGHPVLLRLGPQTLRALFAAPAALIDPTACGVLPADVKRVRIEGRPGTTSGTSGGTFTLERDLDRWVSPEAGGAAIDAAAVDELLRRLAEARATSIVVKSIPAELLVGRIELTGFDGSVLAALDVSADPAGRQVGLDAGDGVARIFPAADAPSLRRETYGLPPAP